MTDILTNTYVHERSINAHREVGLDYLRKPEFIMKNTRYDTLQAAFLKEIKVKPHQPLFIGGMVVFMSLVSVLVFLGLTFVGANALGLDIKPQNSEEVKLTLESGGLWLGVFFFLWIILALIALSRVDDAFKIQPASASALELFKSLYPEFDPNNAPKLMSKIPYISLNDLLDCARFLDWRPTHGETKAKIEAKQRAFQAIKSRQVEVLLNGKVELTQNNPQKGAV